MGTSARAFDLDRRFAITERGSTVRREILGGAATFLTMCYIVFVNPAILSAAGMPFDSVAVATALAAAIFTALMGVLANFPLALATGLGLGTRALVVFVFAVAIIAVHAAAGARSANPEVIEMARAFGAGHLQLYRRVVLPAALPSVLVGLRLGLSRGISGMVAVELLLVAVGLGRLIERFQGDFDAAGVYAVVLVIVAEAVLLTGAVRQAERRLALRRSDTVLA